MTKEEQGQKALSPEAQRALAEARARREEADKARASKNEKTEIGGQKGPEPTRYGDWEKNGIVSDF